MIKIIKESNNRLFEELSNSIMNILDRAESAFRNDELSAEEFEELLQGAIGQIREFADERDIFLESKNLNEDIVSALKILFDNSTLDAAKKIIQAKQIAKSLGIDEKELINESKELNEDLAINAYVVTRAQYVASDPSHKYNDVTFNRTDAALFTEYEDAVNAMEAVNSRTTNNSEFDVKRLRDVM